MCVGKIPRLFTNTPYTRTNTNTNRNASTNTNTSPTCLSGTDRQSDVDLYVQSDVDLYVQSDEPDEGAPQVTGADVTPADDVFHYKINIFR